MAESLPWDLVLYLHEKQQIDEGWSVQKQAAKLLISQEVANNVRSVQAAPCT